ncbi:uncharacterized protein L201_005273 [Kwoniella dendrophila CBS 6074]|uniref:Uncharacterized protein n=1 Tax=Kwoniella dendrophila CBS 6074 TaxID=1295534 RepID=A0AAX4JY79_9TREE
MSVQASTRFFHEDTNHVRLTIDLSSNGDSTLNIPKFNEKWLISYNSNLNDCTTRLLESSASSKGLFGNEPAIRKSQAWKTWTDLARKDTTRFYVAEAEETANALKEVFVKDARVKFNQSHDGYGTDAVY